MTSKTARTTLPLLVGPLVLFTFSQACTSTPDPYIGGTTADGGAAGAAGSSSTGGGGTMSLGGAAGSAGAAGAHGGTGGTAGAAGMAGGGGAGGHGGAAMMPPLMGQCDPAQTPDASIGTFVSPDGSDTAGDGSQAHPFATLSRGLLVGKANVYLRAGFYSIADTVVLPAPKVPTTIDGGWTNTWQRSCSAPEKTQLLGSPTTAPVLRIDGGDITLARLTVSTNDTAQKAADGAPGNSLISVQVTGGALTVLDAVLHSGDASSGGKAAAVMDATGATKCDQVKDCGTTLGSNTGAQGSAGVFAITKDGVTVGNGSDGQPGANGKNGTAGTPAAEHMCYECLGTFSIFIASDTCSTAGFAAKPEMSAPGLCGCGGEGGPGGRGGYGGGASIALLVTGGSATIQGTLSGLRAGAGGNGSSATPGGKPTTGTSGSGDSTLACYTTVGAHASCADAKNLVSGPPSFLTPGGGTYHPDPGTIGWWNGSCRLNPDNSSSSGTITTTAGGPGSEGAPGGQGGPGAGGPSYGVVVLASATATFDESIITVGMGGVNGDGVTRAEALKKK